MVATLLKTALKGELVKVNISHGEKACSIIKGCLKAYKCLGLLMDTRGSGGFEQICHDILQKL